MLGDKRYPLFLHNCDSDKYKYIALPQEKKHIL